MEKLDIDGTEVLVRYEGEIYHDIDGVIYKHFRVEPPQGCDLSVLVTLPSKQFPVNFGYGELCSLRLVRCKNAK
jgi:hypothetical protein